MARFLKVAEVAEQLGVGPRTVYALVTAGKLGCHRIGIGKGRIRVGPDQLAAYVAGSVAVAAPSTPAPMRPRPVKSRHFRFP